MCTVGNLIGALVGGGLAVATGGASLGLNMALATAAGLGSSVGSMLLDKPVKPNAVEGGPNPAADQLAAQDQARAAATARKRAISGGSPRSLLATMGGALGDTSTAQIGSATAAPVTKSALGA